MNRIAFQPMEGADGEPDGRPSELTFRRYRRFAAGGAGLVWLEAVAVCQEGRANPRQLYLNERTYDDFCRLREAIGPDVYVPLQLTHSGRYSRPGDTPAPIVAVRNPWLDREGLEYHVITDGELELLEDEFVRTALLAHRAGFDAVDVKCSHGYLLNELLAAFTREGRYGGTLENRMRFHLNVMDKIRDRCPAPLTMRMSAYDEVPYPYGFGVDREDFHIPDLAEPIKFLRQARVRGMKLVNVTAGNPYYNPHVNRPFDHGLYLPPFHPLQHMMKMQYATRDLKAAFPDMAFAASALSWARQFSVNIAAGAIASGWYDLAGFGRMAFAYSGFPEELRETGRMNSSKVCVCCGKCTELMRYGQVTGCVVRNGEYSELYRRVYDREKPMASKRVGEHI